MRTATRWQRTSAALISALALAAATLAATGSAASASPVRPAAPAAASIGTTAPVTNDAWAAGRRAYGTKATAADAVRSYWTPERMRSAKPIADSPQYLAALRQFQQDGSPSTPDTSAGRQAFNPATGQIKAPPSGFGTQAHNPNYPVGHPTARTSGKVFFSQGGGNFVCSATVINSEGQDTVWSAGHCIHSGRGGVWSSNWQFVPNYDDDLANPRPYGTWVASNLWTRTAWVNNSDFSQDFGVAIMNTLNGNHIVSYLGGQGLIVNAGTNVWINAFGYPAESPFDGGNLWQCWGGSSVFSGQTIKIPCNMTRGSSGGGWFYNWDGNWGWLNGVNSRIDRIVNPTIMISPYFDNDALDLYNATRNL